MQAEDSIIRGMRNVSRGCESRKESRSSIVAAFRHIKKYYRRMLRWPRNGCESRQREHEVKHRAELYDRRGLNFFTEIFN